MDLIKLEQFNNVAPGNLATLKNRLVGDRSYHGIIFVISGGSTTPFTKAHINRLRVASSSKALLDNINGAQLQDINDLYGLGNTAGYLMFYFGDPTARTMQGQHLGDFDTSIYTGPMDIEVEIDSAPDGAQLEAWALVGPPKANLGLFPEDDDLRLHRAMIRSVVDPNAAVTEKHFDIGLGSEAGASIRGIHLFHSALTEFRVKKGGIDIFEQVTPALNDAVHTDFGRTPVAGMYSFFPTFDGNQGESVATVKPNGQSRWAIQTLVTTSGADTIETYADVYTKLGLI